MDLVDLYPGSVITSVGDMIFRLRLFDLRAVVWAESFFSETNKGGLNVMYYILNNPPENEKEIKKWRVFSSTVADVAFYLAKDLEIKTPEEFKKKINNSNPSQSIARLLKSISEVLEKSFPNKDKNIKVTGGEIFQKIIADNEKKQSKSTNWARVYADFYRFGGMSINQFYSLTMRQIDAIYSNIDEGRTRERIEMMQFHCDLKGIPKSKQPKMPIRKEDREEISQEEIEKRKERHNKLFGDPNKWQAM